MIFEEVSEFLNKLGDDLKEGEVGIQKCHYTDLSEEDREEYFAQHRRNLDKIKQCALDTKIKGLQAKIIKALKEVNLIQLKEIGFPYQLNNDGTITYTIVVDTQIEKIIYKEKQYYVPKSERVIRVFGTVCVTLDKGRNEIISYNGKLKGYLHQDPRGSCLCIGNMDTNLRERNKTIEVWLKELQNQFSIANLDSTFYNTKSKLYREVKRMIGVKRLKVKRKIYVPHNTPTFNVEPDDDPNYEE